MTVQRAILVLHVIQVSLLSSWLGIIVSPYFILISEATTPSPPVLSEPPEPMVVPFLGRASFSCVASGYPQPEIQWFKDGSFLPGETSTMLVVGEVSPFDRGFYSCSATNSEGVATSSPAILNIWGMYQYIMPVSVPLPIPSSGPFSVGEIPSSDVLLAISSHVSAIHDEAAGHEVGTDPVFIIYGIETRGNATTLSSDE